MSRPRRLNVLVFPTDGSRPTRLWVPGWVLPAVVVLVALGSAGVVFLVGDYLRVRQLARNPAALERALAEERELIGSLRARIGEIRLAVGSWPELEARLWEPFGPDLGAARRTRGIGGADARGAAAATALRPSALEEVDSLGQQVGEAGRNLRAFARLMEHAGKALALMPSRWPPRGGTRAAGRSRPSASTRAATPSGGPQSAAEPDTAPPAPALGDHVEREQPIGLVEGASASAGPPRHQELPVNGSSVDSRPDLRN